MTRACRLSVIALLVVAVVTSAPPLVWAAALDDPWYSDVPRAWAYTAIRVLWEESVTDGWVSIVRLPGFSLRSAEFRPSRLITRAQWAMLLAKGFGCAPRTAPPCPISDVPTGYLAYGDKSAASWIYAAVACSLMTISGTRFQPDDLCSREQAVVGLIQALGLSPFAEALSEVEVETSLARFVDSRYVSSAHRKEVALAIRLRIIEGYPDGTLKPRNSLTRAEAAMLVYRCCVVRASAAPNPFSPDGDGFEDRTVITITTLNNRNLIWALIDFTPFGSSFPIYQGSLGISGSSHRFTWSGTDDNNRPVPDGLYVYRVRGFDRNEESYWSVPMPLYVSTRGLSAEIRPAVLTPGTVMTVLAATRGDAVEVTAVDLRTGRSLPLDPDLPTGSENNTWRAELVVDDDAISGEYELEVQAAFPATGRWVSLSYYVVPTLALHPDLNPRNCRPGESFTISAVTAGPALEVSAATPWGRRVSLARIGPNHWSVQTTVPLDQEPGQCPIDVTAEFGHLQLNEQVVLSVMVETLSIVDLRFVLTD